MDIALLEKLDLPTFEKLCRVLFDQMGFTAKSTGTGSMPGIGDVIVLYGKTSNAPFALLQCAVAGARVEVIQLSQVKNSMARLGLTIGYLVTVGTSGPGASEYAAANKINLVNGTKFLELINNLPESGRNMLRETIASWQLPKTGDAASRLWPLESSGPPSCAKCGATMKLQVKMKGPHETGKYWQCPHAACGYICAYSSV